ncbi:serine protease, partial [Streptomyces sp. NPDC051098]
EGATVRVELHGPAALNRRLEELIDALERLDEVREDSAGCHRGHPQGAAGVGAAVAPDATVAGDRAAQDRVDDARWWGAHLLGETLLRVPDARAHLPVLRLLADRITRRSVREGGPEHLGGFGEFGPWFWERLNVPEAERLDLLRRLVPADGPPGARRLPRYLDAAAARLADSPSVVQPLLCRWFTDTTPLPAEPGAELRPTVAGAAQALLYARRDLAVDGLTEALVATAHPRADELLAALAEDEPSALCRAVDRWAHDPRPERRVAAAAYRPVTAARVTSEADRELLRYAAFALLARAGDTSLHGPALALLVRDPHTRSRHLGRALAAFTAGDPRLPVSALAVALTTHPEPVLAAFRERLHQPGEGAAEVLRALAEVDEPVLARRAAALVGEYLDHRPEGAAHAAAYVERRLEQGPAARAVLFPLVRGLLRGRPCQVRRALAPVLAAPGTVASRALRSELLDILLDCEEREQEPVFGPAPGYGSAPDAPGYGPVADTPGYGRVAPQRSRSSRDLSVLDAVLRAAALGCATRPQARTRDLVHRTGMLLVRTPEGATCFDRRLVELAREVPGFAAQVAGWLAGAPQEWAAVVGPSARRMVETLGSPVPMRAGSRGHGSLRPA